jgi:hypothetical protein
MHYLVSLVAMQPGNRDNSYTKRYPYELPTRGF